MQNQKKAYSSPTITEHGKVVEQTKGFGGRYWEVTNPKPESDLEVEEQD
jgi:hypothetical protein